MHINYKESQIDFLSHVEGKPEESVRPRYMAASISLSLENLVIFSIVAIMIVIFSFSIGIERGKGMVLTGSSGSVLDVKEPEVTGSGSVKIEKSSGKTDPQDFRIETQRTKSAAGPAKAVVKAKPAVVKPIVTTAKTSNAGAYTLQVASYKGIKSAQREADKLKQKGFDDVYVVPKGAYTIVCVGNFRNKEDASDMKRQLDNRYQGSVVRRL